MKYKDLFNVGTLNVRGITTNDKVIATTEDVRKYNLNVLVIPETHITMEEDIDEITLNKPDINKYTIYSVNKKGNHHHGIGMIIKQEHKPTFNKISDRICKAELKVNQTDVTIIAAYAPTHSNSEKDITVREFFL